MATNIMENDVKLSDYKVGDKVRFIEQKLKRTRGSEIGEVVRINRHFVYVDFGDGGTLGGWLPERFEKVVEKEDTFNYKVALRKLFDNPSIKLERKLKGNEYNWVSCTGTNSRSVYVELNDDYDYRIKPEEKKSIEVSHFVIKSKGKFSVTSKKHADENAVKAAYKYHVDVIQRLKD